MASLSSLCVYCGSSGDTHRHFASAAERLGRLLAENGVRLVYGGGSIGLMGALARAVQQAGGAITGIIPDFLIGLEVGSAPGTELVVVDSMHARKQRMAELADAFAVLPGSIGTLDETIEIITWKQLGLHDKPIVLVNLEGYWNPLLALIERFVNERFARPGIRDLFHIVTSVEDVLPLIARLPAPAASAPGKRALGRT